MINTWDELFEKYPIEHWDELTDEQAVEFTNHCFNLYEKEGFAKRYWTPYSDDYLSKFVGKPFEVVRRLDMDDYDIETLPGWMIRFEDGVQIEAYPEEIIPSEMRANGCKLEDI